MECFDNKYFGNIGGLRFYRSLQPSFDPEVYKLKINGVYGGKILELNYHFRELDNKIFGTDFISRYSNENALKIADLYLKKSQKSIHPLIGQTVRIVNMFNLPENETYNCEPLLAVIVDGKQEDCWLCYLCEFSNGERRWITEGHVRKYDGRRN